MSEIEDRKENVFITVISTTNTVSMSHRNSIFQARKTMKVIVDNDDVVNEI